MIQALLPQLIPIIGGVIDKVVPDNVQKQVAKKELEKALVDNAHLINLETIKTNQVEAAHRSIWVAGWRPAIGWACAAGIAWLFIVHPVALWAMHMLGYPEMMMPTINTEILLELTLAMLGMAGLRTFEKIKGLSK